MSSPHQSVPPTESSHTPAAGAETGSASTTRVIRIPRLAFLGVFILLMCVFFPFVGWPAGLWWLLLIPVVVLVWVLRTQTSVSDAGLDLRTLLGSRHLDWAQVKGVRIPKRGYVLADLNDGTEVKLPAVSYDRLRDLAAASDGRIPNPFAGPEEATGSGSTAAEPAADEAAGHDADTAVPDADNPMINEVAKTSETENADTTGDGQHP